MESRETGRGAVRSPRPFWKSNPKTEGIHVGGRADLPDLPTLWGDRANVVISHHLPRSQDIRRNLSLSLYIGTLGDVGRSRRWHDLPKGLGGLGDLPAPRRGSVHIWGQILEKVWEICPPPELYPSIRRKFLGVDMIRNRPRNWPPSPCPEPAARPCPEPAASPCPGPAASPCPEPAASPCPEPAASPCPGPAASPCPGSPASPCPEPAASPCPEPAAGGLFPFPQPAASSHAEAGQGPASLLNVGGAQVVDHQNLEAEQPRGQH